MLDKLKQIQLPNWLKWTLKIGVTGLAIWIVYQKVNFTEILKVLSNANLIYFIFGLIAFFLTKGLESLRLNVYFRIKNINLNEWTNFKLYLLGLYYNIFLPGGIGGDGYKVYWINKHIGSPLKDVVWCSIHNRISGLAAMFGLAFLAFSFTSLNVPYMQYSALLIPIMYVVYFFVLKLFFPSFTKSFIATNLYSIGVQGLQLVCAHLIIVGMGISEGYADYWFLFLLSNIAFVIPVTVGGVGSRELVFSYGAASLDINLAAALALSLIFYVLRLLSSLVGVYYFMKSDEILSESKD